VLSITIISDAPMMIVIQVTEDSFWQGQVERVEILALIIISNLMKMSSVTENC